VGRCDISWVCVTFFWVGVGEFGWVWVSVGGCGWVWMGGCGCVYKHPLCILCSKHRSVIVCASTFKGSKQLTWLFLFLLTRRMNLFW